MSELKTKYPDDIIREFTVEILMLKEQIKVVAQKIKEKQEFLKAINNKETVKYSELYHALENDTATFWKVKEVLLACRKESYFEIKIHKKYFMTTAQLEIIERHFIKQKKRTKHDIRISQFY